MALLNKKKRLIGLKYKTNKERDMILGAIVHLQNWIRKTKPKTLTCKFGRMKDIKVY